VVTDKAVRAALETLLGSDELVRSPQLAKFLRYIVESRLKGHEQSIKAYSIAVDVFGRPSSFDPQTDPIVRVQARRLRGLIARFYAEGGSTGPVMISMPVGRYVPEFVEVQHGMAAAPPDIDGTSGSEIAAVSDGPDGARPVDRPPAGAAAAEAADAPPSHLRLPLPGERQGAPPLRPSVWAAVAVGLLVLAGLAVLVVSRLLTPDPEVQQTAVASDIPVIPVVVMGSFSNVSGDASLDPIAAGLKAAIAADLAGFVDLSVVSGSDDQRYGSTGLFVTAIVERSAQGIEVSALVTRGINGPASWSTVVDEPLTGRGGTDMVADAARIIAARAATFRGPLHATGRAWLDRQTSLEASPSLYSCMLRFRLLAETEQSTDTAVALSCFERLRKTAPSPAAQAAWAWLQTHVALSQAGPNPGLSGSVGPYLEVARQAVADAPESAFVRAQLARVLDASLKRDEAKREFSVARQLSPADLDILAAYAETLGLDGDATDALAASSVALTTAPNPPPWYNGVPMVVWYKETNYAHALSSALAYAVSNHDAAEVIAIAAAAHLKRQDIVDAYLPELLRNERYRRKGFLAQLGARITDPQLLKAIADGLVLAGVPEAAINNPF
jgi:tetratricopeptide (TPR) repeat protein